MDDGTADAIIAGAWEAGIRSFDTAPHYGVGLSESRLGRFLAMQPREEFVLSTKVGRLLVPTEDDVDGVEGFYGTPRLSRVRDYSYRGVYASLESSLGRLGLDRVDIALIHDPHDYFGQAMEGAYPALAEMRKVGTVRAIGVGMDQAEMLTRFVDEADFDCVLVAGQYSLLDQRAAEMLLPSCQRRGVAVLAASVFNSGVLADPRPDATFDYVRVTPENLARIRRLQAICQRFGSNLGAAAIQFPLRHPAVTGVVVGNKSLREMSENLANLDLELPDALFEELLIAA
jgi:D-threo-aldose 1-dehydrogenase